MSHILDRSVHPLTILAALFVSQEPLPHITTMPASFSRCLLDRVIHSVDHTAKKVLLLGVKRVAREPGSGKLCTALLSSGSGKQVRKLAPGASAPPGPAASCRLTAYYRGCRKTAVSSRPVTHHLVGVGEIAAMLGGTRQRVDAVARRNPNFLSPRFGLPVDECGADKRPITGQRARDGRRPQYSQPNGKPANRATGAYPMVGYDHTK